MVGKPVETGLVQVFAGADGCGQASGAEGVVVAVPVAGPPDPAVLGRVRVQAPEHVGQTVLGGEGTVEVVFERDEERVVGLVPGFEDVQIAEEYCRDGRIADGEGVQAGG